MTPQLTTNTPSGAVVTWGAGNNNKAGTYTGNWRLVHGSPRFQVQRPGGQISWVRFACVLNGETP